MDKPAPARIDLAHIRHYHFARHGVLHGHKALSVREAAERSVGIHAARLKSPYTALHARCDSFANQHLHEALFVNRSVIKLRCMRRTLHIVPLHLAPVVHVATRNQRLTPCRTAIERLGLTKRQLVRTRVEILEQAAHEPITKKVTEKLKRDLFGSRSDQAWATEVLRWTIKSLWEEGSLSYYNQTSEWGREDRAFTLTARAYPGLKLDEIGQIEAERELLWHHIRQYGPVSVNDMTWWSGLSVGRIVRAVHSMGDLVRKVAVDGLPEDLYMATPDLEQLSSYRLPDSDWVALLAYEDSALKGYNQTRSRYVDGKHYDRLFNSIGEVRASIVLNGLAVGVWSYSRDRTAVEWTLFESIPKRLKQLIEREIRAYEIRRLCVGSN